MKPNISMNVVFYEESITRDFIKNENSDVIINSVDATNLSNNRLEDLISKVVEVKGKSQTAAYDSKGVDIINSESVKASDKVLVAHIQDPIKSQVIVVNRKIR